MADRCNKEFDMGGGMLAVCGRFAGHIPVDAHALREQHADEDAPFGPWVGVPRERQLLCAVAECAEEGKPHPCPYDGGFHHHGCIHYDCDAGKRDAKRAGIKFRKGSWGLLCDSDYAALTGAKKTKRG